MAKTTCTVTRNEFNRNAKALDVVIAGVPLYAGAKQFSTGSMGWYLNGKQTVKLSNGQTVEVQIGLNVTVIGSKDLPPAVDESESKPAAPAPQVAAAAPVASKTADGKLPVGK